MDSLEELTRGVPLKYPGAKINLFSGPRGSHMGGTSLLFTGLSLGIILSVSRGEIDEFGTKKTNTSRNIANAA